MSNRFGHLREVLMTELEKARYERIQRNAFVLTALWLMTAAGIGIAVFSDHKGFWRDQAVKRALAERRAAEREFGPVIPTSFNL